MSRLRLALVLLACAALPATAASRIVPATPTAFERVNLRMTVDSCAFNPGTVHVSAAANTLRVTQQLNACLLPGEPQVVDVRLGSLPAGDYRVEVFASPRTDGPPAETLSFQVREPAEVAVFPPPPRPLTDYTGLWHTPAEAGWGLAVHQGPTHVVFGALFVYGASSQPEWFTLQLGRWTSSTRWTGTLYRTTGPFFAGPDFDPRLVLILPAGTAEIDFAHRPGEEGRARLTYTVNGMTVRKVIERLPL